MCPLNVGLALTSNTNDRGTTVESLVKEIPIRGKRVANRCWSAGIASAIVGMAMLGGASLAHGQDLLSDEASPAVGQFEKALAALAPNDQDAAQALDEFHQLNAEQQETLENLVASGDAAEQLIKSMDSEAALPEGARVAEAEYSDGPMVTRRFSSFNAGAEAYDQSTESIFEQRIFGILITRLRQDFTWEVEGNSVSATKRCDASTTNFNFAVHLESSTTHWVQDGYGICETVWAGSLFFKDFAIRADKIQRLEAGADGYIGAWLTNA